MIHLAPHFESNKRLVSYYHSKEFEPSDFDTGKDGKEVPSAVTTEPVMSFKSLKEDFNDNVAVIGRFICDPQLIDLGGLQKGVMNLFYTEEDGGTIIVMSRHHNTLDMRKGRYAKINSPFIGRTIDGLHLCIVLKDNPLSLQPAVDPNLGNPFDVVPLLNQVFGEEWSQEVVLRAIRYISNCNKVLKSALLNLSAIHFHRKDYHTCILFAVICYYYTKSPDSCVIIMTILGELFQVQDVKKWAYIAAREIHDQPDYLVEDEKYRTMMDIPFRRNTRQVNEVKEKFTKAQLENAMNPKTEYELIFSALRVAANHGGIISPILHPEPDANAPIDKNLDLWELTRTARNCINKNWTGRTASRRTTVLSVGTANK
jgi:hypothetical protein